MYFNKLGFFKNDQLVKNQAQEDYFKRQAENYKIKLKALLDQDFVLLNSSHLSKKIAKQKPLSARVKYIIDKRRAKKRLVLRNRLVAKARKNKQNRYRGQATVPRLI